MAGFATHVRSAAWRDALGATGQEAVRVAGASTVCVEGASTEASTMRKPAGTRAAAAAVALVRAPVLCWVCSCSSLSACPWPTPRSSTSSLCACSCSACVRWVCLRAAAGDGRAEVLARALGAPRVYLRLARTMFHALAAAAAGTCGRALRVPGRCSFNAWDSSARARAQAGRQQ